MRRFPVVTLAVLLVMAITLPALSWGSTKRITNTRDMNEFNADVAGSPTFVHVVWNNEWQEETWPYRTHRDVLYRRSINGATTWKGIVQLSANTLQNQEPAVVSVERRVHVVWQEYDGSTTRIRYRRSADGGKSWSPIRKVPYPRDAYSPAAAFGGGSLHVVLVGATASGDLAVFHRAKVSGDWLASLVGPADVGTVADVCSAASGTHVVWSAEDGNGNERVYYRRLRGEWSARRTIGFGEEPSIDCTGNRVAVAWIDKGEFGSRIRVRTSSDGGDTWGARWRVSPLVDDVRRPDIEFLGSTAHVVWADLRPAGFRTYHRSTTDMGVTWSARTAVPGSGGDPRIDAGGLLHLVDEKWFTSQQDVVYRLGP